MNELVVGLSPTNAWLYSILFSLAGFFLGSIPFSVVIGKLGAGVDIRRYGDHNPGMTNVLRAAGWKLALPALLLDAFKGTIPVGIAWFGLGLQGMWIVPVALAPVLGHAFSPFLGWRGGKAVAVTFGIWAGLTVGAGPTILGFLLGLMYTVFENSGWAMMLAFTLFGGFILTYYGPNSPELVAVWLGNLLILIAKHADDLRSPPAIRKSLLKKASRAR
jgi:acyl phosphate:glycerol-3-phosphate acyltransferase